MKLWADVTEHHVSFISLKMAPKIVLITGASSGIGLAIAVLLAQDVEKRFKVYATMRNLAKKEQLEEEGKHCLGDTMIIKQLDVCHDDSVDRTVKEVIQSEGRIDVLINNAGVAMLTVLECTPMEEMKNVFEVNYFGTVRLTKAVIPHMKAKENGHIINMSSVGGVVGFPGASIYSSSKFAVEGLTESLAPSLRQFNIRCSLIEPGPVDTPMIKAGGTNESVELPTVDQKTRLINKRVFTRFGELLAQPDTVVSPKQVAEVVKEAILSDKPHFRYQTNKNYCPDEIPAKLADVTGNKSIDIVTKRFCAE